MLWCGVVGPALFVVSFGVQGALRPAYDPLRHPISSLALGAPLGWVQTATFMISGVLVLGYACGLWLAGCGRWVPPLVGLVGVGLIGAGVFPCDPVNGYPPGSPVPTVPTVTGSLHDLFSTPVFVALPAACLVMAHRFRRSGRRHWASYSMITAGGFWACFVFAALGFNQISPFVGVGGLCQRLSILLGFGWLAVLAVDLLLRDASLPT